MEKSAQAVFLLLIYFLVTFGYSFSLGFYYLPGFILLLTAFLLLSAFYFFPKLFENFKLQNYSFESLLTFAAILSIALSLVLYGGLYQEKGALFNLSLLLLAFSLLLSLSYLFQPSNSPTSESPISSNILQYPLTLLSKYRFLIFLTIAFLLRLFMLISSPNPQIDVFDILKNGPKALLEGKNPYSATYTPLYKGVTPNYFAYPPGILLLVTPFVWLFNEPRLVFLLAEIITGLVIFYKLRKKNLMTAEILPVLILFNPRSLFVLEQSWIDPLATLLILLIYLLLKKDKLEKFSFLAIGFLLTIKQTLIFIPFLLLKNFKVSLQKIALVALPIILIVAPFFLWDKAALIEDLIVAYLTFPPARLELLRNSLSIPSFFYQQFGIDIAPLLSFLLTGIFFIILLFNQKKGWVQFFMTSSLFFLFFHLVNRIAFTDHYYFVGNLLVLGILAFLQEDQKTNS